MFHLFFTRMRNILPFKYSSFSNYRLDYLYNKLLLRFIFSWLIEHTYSSYFPLLFQRFDTLSSSISCTLVHFPNIETFLITK